LVLLLKRTVELSRLLKGLLESFLQRLNVSFNLGLRSAAALVLVDLLLVGVLELDGLALVDGLLDFVDEVLLLLLELLEAQLHDMDLLLPLRDLGVPVVGVEGLLHLLLELDLSLPEEDLRG
jgi:hypothetical protein